MTHLSTMEDQLAEAVHQNSSLTSTGILERVFSRLFHGLVYPQIWEDPDVDMAALNITGDDNIVCIASGGCNMMSYLTAGPAAIDAVDLSPAHVALNRLKLTAIQHLPDHQRFYDFFGRGDLRGNKKVYKTLIAPLLDRQSRDYWEGRGVVRQRISMFTRGFYRFGLLGRFLGLVHLICRIGRVDFQPLLDAKTLDEQRAYFEEKVEPLFDMKLVRFLVRRRASLFGLGIPPAQYDKLAADGGGDVLPILRARVRKLMCDFPISENYFAWQAFNRAYNPKMPRPLPPYLQQMHFETVRANAPKARVHNRSITDLLAEAPAQSKDCFVLLDAQDWMTDAQLNALWSEITRTAKPGARVIFRTGGVDDILPGRVVSGLLDQWQYQAEQSADGQRNDRSSIYGGFHLYTLRP